VRRVPVGRGLSDVGVGVRREVHRVDAGRDGELDDAALDFEPLPHRVVPLDGVDPDPHRVLAPDPGSDGPHGLDEHPGPPLHVTTPAVGAGVARGEELVDEVAVPGVQLDPVVAGSTAAVGGVDEPVDHPGDVVLVGHALATFDTPCEWSDLTWGRAALADFVVPRDLGRRQRRTAVR
jgi:hypothetical protein